MKYKEQYSLVQRIHEADRILKKFPDRIPIICEKSDIAPNDCPQIDKKKYLVPKDLIMGHFLCVIRNRLNVGPEKGVFLFAGDSMVSSAACVSDLYYHKQDPDRFLYITYSFENVFG